MSDQWDPKWPKTGEVWSLSYDKAEKGIKGEPRWRAAFAAVVGAYGGGELAAMVAIYRQGIDRNDKRDELWEHVRDQIFVHPPEDMPPYAQAIWDAVPLSWTEPGDLGDEAIASWAVRKIVAFKTVVLFIAGLLEERLSPSLASQSANENAPERLHTGRRLFLEIP